MPRQLSFSLFSKSTSPIHHDQQNEVLTEPRLPPELENLVFLYAYWGNPQDARNLIQASRRVKEWLCPVIFKVVFILCYEKFPLKNFDLQTFDRYGKYIKHLEIDLNVYASDYDRGLIDLIFDLDAKSLSRFLSKLLISCPNLVNLSVYSCKLTDAKGLVPALSSLSLTYVAIHLPFLFRQLHQLVPRNNLPISNSKTGYSLNPAFPTITHLQAIGHPFDIHKEETQTLLLAIHFPNLTHLAIDRLQTFRSREGVRLALERCQKLEMMVWLHWVSPFESTSMLQDFPVADGRIVQIYRDKIKTWKDGATGEGPGLWEMADQKRKFVLNS